MLYSCCIVSIIRTTTIFGTSDNHDPLCEFTCTTINHFIAYLTASGYTGSVALISVWSAIELNTGIIVACLPMLRQSFFLIFPRSRSAFETASHSIEHFPHRIKDYRFSRSAPTSTAPDGRPSHSATHNETFSMGAVRSDADHGHTRTDGRTESQERIVSM